MDALSEELILNILHRLPVKSIGCYLCINNSWGPLIKTPSFVSSDSKIHNKDEQYLFIWGAINRLELCLDNDTFDCYKLLTLPVDARDFIFDDDYTVCGISVCNGMICFFMYPDIIMLWNPTIHRFLTLPQPTLVVDEIDQKNTVTLWFDSITDDYKVIRFIYKEAVKSIEPPQVEIFSLNNNSWKIISRITPPFEIGGPSIPILNDTLYWIGYGYSDCDPIRKRNSILGFDVNAEVLWTIDFPNILKLLRTSFNIAVYKETSIAICCHESGDGTMEVWVMKEYRNIESWTNIWKNDPSHQSLHDMSLNDECFVIRLLNNGQVLWEVFICIDLDAHYLAIISTDPKNGLMKRQVVLSSTYYREDVRYFEESLVLLDNANARTLDDSDDE